MWILTGIEFFYYYYWFKMAHKQRLCVTIFLLRTSVCAFLGVTENTGSQHLNSHCPSVQNIHPFSISSSFSPLLSLSLLVSFLIVAHWLCNQPSQRWLFCFCLPYLLLAVSLSVIILLLAFHPGAKTQDSHWPYSRSYAQNVCFAR